MTLGDLLSDLYRDFNYADSPATAVTTRFKASLNKAHAAILREPGLSRLRDTLTPLTFASVASQAVYGLPAQLSRVTAITDRTSSRILQSMSHLDVLSTDPGLSSTGTPWAFILRGYGPTQYIPASTGIWVASASAADTTQTAQVNGVRTGGLPTGDITASLNGVTRVQLGTLTDYVDIQSLSLTAVGAGIVSFYDAATAGNTLAQIPIGMTYPKYLRIQLYPIPSAAITYYVDGQLHIPTLDDTQDVPMIPEEFHDLLAAYARMREYEKAGDLERTALAGAEWTKGVGRLRHMIGTSPAETPVMGRPGTRRLSRFGSWTPADTW